MVLIEVDRRRGDGRVGLIDCCWGLRPVEKNSLLSRLSPGLRVAWQTVAP